MLPPRKGLLPPPPWGWGALRLSDALHGDNNWTPRPIVWQGSPSHVLFEVGLALDKKLYLIPHQNARVDTHINWKGSSE